MKKNKQIKEKRGKGVIIGGLNGINDAIMEMFTGGFFAKLFSSKERVDELKENSFLFRKRTGSSPGKNIRRTLLKKYDESRLRRAFSALISYVRSCKANVFGTFLIFFGVTSMIVFFAKYFSAGNYIDEHVFFEEAFMVSLVMIFASMPLIASGKRVSELMNEGLVIKGVFSDALGIPEARFEPPAVHSGSLAHILAVIFGMSAGALTYLVSPISIIVIILILVMTVVIMHFPEIGVLISVILAPLVGFMDHPTTFISSIVAVTSISFLVKVAIGKRYIKFGLTDVMVLIFGVMIFFGGIITAGGVKSFESAIIYISFLAIYFLIVNLMNTREWLAKCVDAIALSSSIVSLFGIISYTNVAMPSGWIDLDMFSEISNRAVSTFSNPNMLATYLIITAPLLWMKVVDKRSRKSGKILALIGSILSFVCVVLTWSRGGWLGYIAALLTFLMINYRYTLKYLLIIGVAVPFAEHFVPQNIMLRINSIGSLADSSTYYRIFTWRGSIQMLGDHFWGGIGVGPSAFNQIYPIYSYIGTEATVHSHNLFLQIAIELGIIGLIVFLLAMIGTVKSGFDCLKKTDSRSSRLAVAAGLSGLLAALVHGMVDYIWYNYRVFFIFWVVVAIICAYAKTEKEISAYTSAQTEDASANEGTLNIVFHEN